MTKEKYKVWGGLTMKNGKQMRTIVATKTKKRAIEIISLKHNIPRYYFNEYWCETGNEKEIALAMAQPGMIFYINN